VAQLSVGSGWRQELASFDTGLPKFLRSLFVLLLLLPVLAPASDPVAARQRELAIRTGIIAGRLTDAVTGEPLEEVDVSAKYLGDSTDAAGAFRIMYLDPGIVKLIAWRRDLVPSSQRVKVSAGRTVSVHLKMVRAPRACCRLEGEWNITLILDKGRAVASGRAGKQVEGTIRFSSAIPDPLPDRRRTRGDPTVDEFGEYRIDLRPFFGAAITKSLTNTVFPGREGADILTEVDGYVYNESQVEIRFIPRMSHGGISLSGRVQGDSIRGSWIKRDFAPRFEGHFVMKRAQRP